MEKTIKKDGYTYLVIHLYSENNYGYHNYFHVLTNNPKYSARLMPELCGYSGVESKALHDLNYQRNPSIENSLKPYYECEYIDNNLYETLGKYQDKGVDLDGYYSMVYTKPCDD